MDCLEINVHQLILTDLSRNIGEAIKHGAESSSLSSSIERITSKVETRNVTKIQQKNDPEASETPRVFMTASQVQCNIGFAELCVKLPNEHVHNVVSVLKDMLCDVLFLDFDTCLSWNEWSLPDQFVFAIVSALLRMASKKPQFREDIVACILSFVQHVVQELNTGGAVLAISQVAPAFHGFYRAITSTQFEWMMEEWQQMSASVALLFTSNVPERFNNLVVEALDISTEDRLQQHFIKMFMTRYLAMGRPLTGYFMICCVVEIQWTILSQALVFHDTTSESDQYESDLAIAANVAWLRLTQDALKATGNPPTQSQCQSLEETIHGALQLFTELLSQIEDMDLESSVDTYAWETMAECLKLATVCAVALRSLPKSLVTRLKLLLSDKSPVAENLVQEAALKSLTLLVRNFTEISTEMTAHLRRFVTAPLPLFEFEFISETHGPPPLAAAAKCLALCIKLSPGDDLLLSNIYSLLNYIAATSQDTSSISTVSRPPSISNVYPEDHETVQSLASGMQSWSEEQRRHIGISTIHVVTRLALEFQVPEVTRLTTSMLLQRLRGAEPTVEAAIVYNLVSLALVAPRAAAKDIFRALSYINRTGNQEDPSYSSNMVVAQQTRLAREIRVRPDLCEPYLKELLSLFSEKGIAIQVAANSPKKAQLEDMIDQLAALILPIEALLSHKEWDPSKCEGAAAFVPLFRNMWLLCTLFGFSLPKEQQYAVTEWQRPSLARIAEKTPPIVVEQSQDYVLSDLEYNSVIRQNYATTVIGRHKSMLQALIHTRASDIRHLPSAHVVFLLTVHTIETMRAAKALPSSLVWNFSNVGLNRHHLGTCLQLLSETIIRDSINEMSKQVVDHSLPETLSSELQSLLLSSCHRVESIRRCASKYLDRLITSFPSLMCDPPLVYAILEVLTLLQKACAGQYTDEYNPIWEFRSERTLTGLSLPDSFHIRNQLLGELLTNSNNWFDMALARAPLEFQATLQQYLSSHKAVTLPSEVELGASIALRFACAIPPGERKISHNPLSPLFKADRTKAFTDSLASVEHYIGEAHGLRDHGPRELVSTNAHGTQLDDPIFKLKTELSSAIRGVRDRTSTLKIRDMKSLLFRCAAMVVGMPKRDYVLLNDFIVLPFEIFSPAAIAVGIQTWTWLIGEKPELEFAIMTAIDAAWTTTIKNKRGIFAHTLNYDDPFNSPVEYNPTDKALLQREQISANRLLTPHSMVLQMLLSRFQAARYDRRDLVLLILRLILRSAMAFCEVSTHALAREPRFSFLLFGFEALKSSRMDSFCENKLREVLYAAALSWFACPPQWSYGSNRTQIDADIRILMEFLSLLQTDSVRGSHMISSLPNMQREETIRGYKNQLRVFNRLLKILTENELSRLGVWSDPLREQYRGYDHVANGEKAVSSDLWRQLVDAAWKTEPAIAVHLLERCKTPLVDAVVQKLIRQQPSAVLHVPEALKLWLKSRPSNKQLTEAKLPLLWDPVPPITAITLLQPPYQNNGILTQYAQRVLGQHPVEVTFFFIPQVVQALRCDKYGYAARFVFQTTCISQLFCHQIIWNMKANCYKDDSGEIEDSIKPTLDLITERIVQSLDGEARAFYVREFTFFDKVTSISGKLKPFIKKTKPEKKAKIDEEMAKINVDVGVYLPSNPDGIVVDIDKRSGRPLQSHAKAPFMATFKVRKETVSITTDPDSVLGEAGEIELTSSEQDVWQAAIFKVGDDCRQDVLALQVIAMFKNIFASVGLPLYLYPYRVTATAPGCGVIDVVPNATSRDEMGRAKINDLTAFFIAKYGGEETIAFEQARVNFIQSMAGYSLACYILQIKDRHNGNIMIDGEGHIVHIDFGFLFDIGPGGVKFEPNSFKLTREMVTLMGGRDSQGYDMFQRLTVKGFLAIRPYAGQIVNTVQLMLGADFPSFKGDASIQRLRDRFALGLNERQAADWMVAVIADAHENFRSTVYDEFQRLQNGIPYA